MFKFLFITVIAILFASPLQAQMDVMSYNIRYANENDGENSWSLRKDYITNQIKYYEPDILGVQEAVLEQLEYFKEHLEGYKYVGVGRDDGKLKGEYSAIFYNTLQFEVLQENTFWLSPTPKKVSVGWDAAMERVCTYALFQSKESGKKLWVFNSHFDHIGDKARLESAKLILKKITDLNPENYPVIFMGDFNLEPEKEGIILISKELNDSKESSKFSFGPVGTFNGFKFCEPVTRRIDYIFTSKKDIEVLKYAVITDSKDLKYPSDHFPVMVKLLIK
jgi:endonuclease/exonuclease/phosphatase family metal-dependent hydrolase